VNYRETIQARAEFAYLHKKQVRTLVVVAMTAAHGTVCIHLCLQGGVA
jgi:hypothetical protein